MSQHSDSKRFGRRSIATFQGAKLWITVAMGSLLSLSAVGHAAEPCAHCDQVHQSFDVRHHPDKAPAGVGAKLRGNKRASEVRNDVLKGKADLAAQHPDIDMKFDEYFGVPNQISNSKGVLEQPVGGKPEETVKSFVTKNHRVFGLSKSVESQVKTEASYENPENKAKWVTLKQEIGGIPVFRSELKAALKENGELTAITNELAPGLTEDVLQNPVTITAEDAVAGVAKGLKQSISTKDLVRTETSDDALKVDFKPYDKFFILRAEQVIFPLAAGQGTLGWQVLIGFDGDAYGSVVDASSGELLFQKSMKNHQTQDATYLIFDAESPAPGNPWPDYPVLDGFDMPKAPNVAQVQKRLISEYAFASPEGWLPDYENLTRGNNATAYRDQIAPDGVDQDVFNPFQLSYAYGNSNGPSLFNRNFRFAISPAPDGEDGPEGETSHSLYNDAVVTNMFFWANRYHDYMYRLGFTEAARNFQGKNFGRGGFGNDPIIAEALDFTGTNNANFMTLPDGAQGRMQMYAYEVPGEVSRDSGFDQHIMVHELTHGLTNRLIGNAFGLQNQQGGGMGEGWSDFFSTSILSEFPDGKNQDPDLTSARGGWANRGFVDSYFYGNRPFPYTTDRTKNPLTFKDTDPYQYSALDVPGVVPESPRCLSRFGAQVHNLGHIWSTILWEARREIMRSFEDSPAYASAEAAWFNGNRHMLQLATDGLKLTPSNPTFVEARDAIINAALNQTTPPAGWQPDPNSQNQTIAAHDEVQLWKGFAARGLGYKAVAAGRLDGVAVPMEPENHYSIQVSEFGIFRGSVADDVTLKDLDDDDSRSFNLPGPDPQNAQIPGTFTYFGRTFSRIFVNTNGTVTFEDEDLDTDVSLGHHFLVPRVSGLLCDLDGSTTAGKIAVAPITEEGARGLSVSFLDMPLTGIEPGDDNTNTFQIRILCDTASGELGKIKIVYGTCTAPHAIVGLSPGPEAPVGPYYTEDTMPIAGDMDLSLLGFCNTELGKSYYTEEFTAPTDPFDLENFGLDFLVETTTGWINPPTESYSTPLEAREPSFVNQEGEATLGPGDDVFIRVPLESKLKKGNLSGVLGLLLPMSDGVDVIDPVSDYGNLKAGNAVNGDDPFIIRIDPSVPCGAQIQLKVAFTSDQGLSGEEQNIVLTVGGGFGAPQGSLAWPQNSASGTLAVGVDENATQLTLNPNPQNMQAALNLKNTRTGEVVKVTSWNNRTRAMTVVRGQKGTAKQAMLANDGLVFDSAPIPDATQFGINLTVKPTDPNIQGPVGRIRVKIGKLTHPNVADLKMTLSNSQGYKMTLLENMKAALGSGPVYTNITLDTSAPLSIQNPNGIESGGTYRPVENFDIFRNPNFDAGSTWTLTVSDTLAPYTGDISDWSIELSPFHYCTVPTLATYEYAGGALGWTPNKWPTEDGQSLEVKSPTATQPGTLVLHTDPHPSIRIPSWTSPGMQLTPYTNQVYRLHAWVSRAGQAGQSELPFLRLRLSVGHTLVAQRLLQFDTTKFDPWANTYSMSMAPSTNRKAPTHYQLDFDPVDVPSLYNNPENKLTAGIDNYSMFPEHQGDYEVVETRIERYSAPPEDSALRVWNFTPADFVLESSHATNYETMGNEYNASQARPTVQQNNYGITVDSTHVPAEGLASGIVSELNFGGKDVYMQPDRLYRIRYHVTSNTPSSSNPVMRFRAHSIKWADANEVMVGPSNLGFEHHQQLGKEALPGPGTQNINKRQGETQGGYYDQFISSPPVVSTDPEVWKLRLGFDLFDFGYEGKGTPAQQAERGRFTLDGIQVHEYYQPTSSE